MAACKPEAGQSVRVEKIACGSIVVVSIIEQFFNSISGTHSLVSLCGGCAAVATAFGYAV